MTPTPPDKDELDEILLHLQRTAAELSLGKGLTYKQVSQRRKYQRTRAKQAINRLIAKERLDELKESNRWAISNNLNNASKHKWFYYHAQRKTTLEQSLKEVITMPTKTCLNINCPERTGGECNAPKGVFNVMTPTPPDKDELLEQPYHVYEGSKIKFFNEKQAYTVQCNSERFTICTKPLNIHKTVLYTIIDWQEQRRGPENLVFGMGAETKEQCLEMLVRLLDGRSGRSEVSHRHDVPLKGQYRIEWIKNGKDFVYKDATLEQSLKEEG